MMNAVEQIEAIGFSTKAETLEKLAPILKTANILPWFYFNAEQWHQEREDILQRFWQLSWSRQILIVRSSTQDEDSSLGSMAGHYESVLGVSGQQGLIDAIEKVLLSYGHVQLEDQVLIQPMLRHIKLGGVAFTVDPETGAPYYIIDFDDSTGMSDTVTSGSGEQLKQYIHHTESSVTAPPDIHKVILTLKELTAIFSEQPLDVEFAINHDGQLYLFQVRPLLVKRNKQIDSFQHAKLLKEIERYLIQMAKPHPYLYGQQTIYGVMPDWNPAEIIGLRPKALSLSLYRELVTDSVWAYQRDNYGYLNLRSFPLMVELGGLPYIDVRVSLNSFLPKKLSPSICEKLVAYYLNCLIQDPALHDKVEFEIVFSCYTLDITNRLRILLGYGFSELECAQLKQELVSLTNSIIHNDHGYWKKDLKKTKELIIRQQEIIKSDLPMIPKLYWFIEDCKRYGTLPFAGLARAGFIAMQILKSFVTLDIISSEELNNFLSTLNTVTSELQKDFCSLNKKEFISKYGHLRPGTYDILSPCYQQDFEKYFGGVDIEPEKKEEKDFKLSVQQLRKIQEFLDKDGITIDVLDLLEFIKEAIEAREYSKFIFTKSVSEFLELLVEYANNFGISREECSNIEIKDLLSLYSTSENPQDVLLHSVKRGEKRYEQTKLINLPPLITNPQQVWSYELSSGEGNFITHSSVIASVAMVDQSTDQFDGAILMIPSADPGYDWIFTKNIAGLITQYGGANSHMAIRASELNIPAVIGAGKVQYERWAKAGRLLLDCLNHQVKVIH